MNGSALLDNISTDKAFIQLHQEHFKPVMKYLVAHTRDKHLAEDIAQETFLVAWNSMDKLLTHPNVQAWFITTARNLMMNQRRKQQKHKLLLSILKELHPGEYIAEQDDVDIFSGLSPADTQIISMYYIDHMDTRELAKALAIKESTARSRLARARNKLEKLLGEKGFLTDATSQ